MSDDSLFNDSEDFELPGTVEEAEGKDEYNDLITQGVEGTITQQEIRQVLVTSEAEIECPSYLLDMSNVNNITEESLRAIEGLMPGEGIAVYVRNKNVTMKVGYGPEDVFYTILYGVLKQMYNGQCIIYRNKGNGFEPIKESEVDSVRQIYDKRNKKAYIKKNYII
jgi:hypothetical protein